MTSPPVRGAVLDKSARTKRLRWAIATSGLSKLAGFAVQLIMLPIILHAVGRDTYAAFLALTALLAWIGLLGFGLLPALAQSLAALATVRNTVGERALILTALAFSAVITLALGVILIVFGDIVDVRPFIGAAGLPANGVHQAFVISAALVALMFFGSVAGAIRAGFQEVHITNFWALGANLVSLAAGLTVARTSPSLVAFIIVIQLPLALAAIGDIGLIIYRRPYLRGIPRLVRGELSKLLITSRSVWIVQLTSFANLNLTLLAVAHFAGATAAAGYGSVLRLQLLLSGIVALIITPLVPAIASADALGDLVWIRRSARTLTGYTLAVSFVFGTVLSVAGPQLIQRWLGSSLGLTPTLCAVLGGYFVLWMLHFAQFNILLGLGETRGLARIYATSTAVIFSIGLALLPRLGATGMAIGLFAGTLLVTTWQMALRVRVAMRRRQTLVTATADIDRVVSDTRIAGARVA
jgi:O-antigen/teichoic acid export membrane protein